MSSNYKWINITFILVFLSAKLFSQDNSIKLFAVNTDLKGKITEQYTDGDSLSTAFFKKSTLILLKDEKDVWKKTGDIYLSSYKISIYYKGKPMYLYEKTSKSWAELETVYAEMLEKIVIDSIKGTSIIDNKSVQIDIPSITLYKSKTKKCAKGNLLPLHLTVEGKLLTGTKIKVPLINQTVTIKSAKTSEIQSATTDKYGDFSFQNLNPYNNYSIEVASGSNIIDNTVYLAKSNGVVVKEMKRNGETFVYELLPTEIISLSKEKEEDTKLAVNIFSSSKNKELILIENIYYEEGAIEIKPESFSKLDEIAAAMSKNVLLYLTINSFTDSKGDDESNFVLSQKRAQKVLDYFVSKGIRKERLTAKGFGEAQLLNRCLNGVDCSDKEHQLNRRTEFKFTK
ncbi:MAG: OmpA family protein [Bacteroidetes bacterium]|nr:OmpA family protein [Bacteroidota bacterium]